MLVYAHRSILIQVRMHASGDVQLMRLVEEYHGYLLRWSCRTTTPLRVVIRDFFRHPLLVVGDGASGIRAAVSGGLALRVVSRVFGWVVFLGFFDVGFELPVAEEGALGVGLVRADIRVI